MRQTDYRGAAVRAPTIKRFVGPILVYRLIKSGSRREHAARIDNGCLIARKARHRDEQLGDMNRPRDRETTARRIEIEEPFLQRGRILAGRTACQIRRQTQRQTLRPRSEEHTSELQSLMRISYAVFCLQKRK